MPYPRGVEHTRTARAGNPEHSHADSPPAPENHRNAPPAGLWELANLRQFVGWKYAPNPDGQKPKKPPINPHTGELANPSKPETWGTYTEAERATNRYGLVGFGFVFTPNDPYAGADLDNCRNPETGELEPWAERVIKAFDSYAEVSPSGTGVKIICRGRLPDWSRNRKDQPDGGRIEVYDRRQYFTLTGKALEPGKPIRDAQLALVSLCRRLWPEAEASEHEDHAPPDPVALEDEELLERARRSRHGAAFAALFDRGDTGRYESPSEADMDLCGKLAFWTNRDAERMDRLFRRSALMRQKWEREDYRRRTIETAIRGCKSGYTPRPKALPEVAEAIRKLRAWAEREPWTGKGGPTDWKAFGYLLNTGGGYGRARRGGIEVSVAQRDMAPAIGQALSSTRRSLERLQAGRRIKILDPGDTKRPAKILVRYLPESVHIEKPPSATPPVFNMHRLRELLFKIRNPAPDMPEYDRNGRRISPKPPPEFFSPLGGLSALIIEKCALSPSGLTDLQLAECLKRRPEKIRDRLPAIREAGLLVEASGVYRPPPVLLERLERELEDSGCNEAERRDRERIEKQREARKQFVRDRQREPEPDGFIEDLEPLERVEASEWLEQPPAPVGAPDAVITEPNAPDQFRELAHVLRTGLSRRDAHKARRDARRMTRALDRERGGYERRRDAARISPAAFLRSELRGVSGMRYREMLRRWKELGGRAETLDGAISAGPFRLKREPLDYNQPYVYPGVSLVSRGAA